MVAVVVVLAAVGGTTAFLLSRGDDTSQTATERRTDEPTGSPSDEPTDEPTEEPTETPTPEPTEEPTEAPTEDPGAGRGPAFTYTEFDDDWKFKLDDVRLRATFEKGWDFDTCDPVQLDGKMSALGCQRASELTYQALQGQLQVSHIVFTMDSPRAAKRAVGKDGLPTDAWTSEPETYVDGVTNGRYKTQAVNQFVVLTFETHQSSVTDERAADFLGYKAADLYGAFLFR